MPLCLHPVGSFWCVYICEYQQFDPPTLAGIPLAFGACSLSVTMGDEVGSNFHFEHTLHQLHSRSQSKRPVWHARPSQFTQWIGDSPTGFI